MKRPVRDAGSAVLVWVLSALGLALAPWLLPSDFSLTLLAQTGTLALVTLSLGLLHREAGLLSFGHAVYVGLGAFATAHALHWCAGTSAWVTALLMPLAGGLGGLAAAAVFGWLSTRQSGTGFAMITLAIGELVVAAAPLLPGVFGGEAGIRVDRAAATPWLGLDFRSQLQVYGLVACWLLPCAWLLHAFARTPLGRLANGARDNPERLAHLGYDPAGVRWRVMLVAGFFAGIAGGLATLNFEIANIESSGAWRSATYLLYTLIGGTGQFVGPLLGAALGAWASTVLAGWTRWWMLDLGALFLLLVLVAPGGLVSLPAAWRRLRRRSDDSA